MKNIDGVVSKGRIVQVGTAGYTENGDQMLTRWYCEGGDVAINFSAKGPDESAIGGWTFRELHAIANGIGPNVERVRTIEINLCEHCWHGDCVLLSNPPISVSTCCWCGDKKSERPETSEKHGRFV